MADGERELRRLVRIGRRVPPSLPGTSLADIARLIDVANSSLGSGSALAHVMHCHFRRNMQAMAAPAQRSQARKEVRVL